MSNSIFNNIRVVLLDRDGVINEEPGPILSPEKFVMIPKSAAAVARLNARGWRCFVITNQAAFARGDLSESVFQTITEKMRAELEKSAATVVHFLQKEEKIFLPDCYSVVHPANVNYSVF